MLRHRGQPNGLSSLWAEGQSMLYTRYRKLVYASNSFIEKVGCIKDLKVIVVYKAGKQGLNDKDKQNSHYIAHVLNSYLPFS